MAVLGKIRSRGIALVIIMASVSLHLSPKKPSVHAIA